MQQTGPNLKNKLKVSKLIKPVCPPYTSDISASMSVVMATCHNPIPYLDHTLNPHPVQRRTIKLPPNEMYRNFDIFQYELRKFRPSDEINICDVPRHCISVHTKIGVLLSWRKELHLNIQIVQYTRIAQQTFLSQKRRLLKGNIFYCYTRRPK